MIYLYILCGFSIVGGIGLVLCKQPIRSALWLLASMVSLAGIYVLLDAPMIAALQIIIYAGAIMTLIVYILMLLDMKLEDFYRRFADTRFWALAFLFVLGGIGVVKLAKKAQLNGELGAQLTPVPENFGSVVEIARSLLGKYLMAFEATSFIVLAGIVAVIVLVNREAKRSQS